MKITKISFCALAAFGLVVSAGCTINITPPDDATESFSLSEPTTGVQSLFVDWRNGEIIVRVDGDATEITATGVKRVTATSEAAAEEAMENFEIVFTDSTAIDDQLVLEFDAPRLDVGVIYRANVEVVLPAGLTLIVESSNGDITVRGNTEATDVELANGDVTIEMQEGDTTVELANGDIDVQSDGADVEAVVDNGRVIIVAAPGDSGTIIGRADIGSVNIRVPVDTEASLSLETSIGSLSYDLEGFDINNLNASSTQVTAILNGGGGQIIGETSIGNVEFSGP